MNRSWQPRCWNGSRKQISVSRRSVRHQGNKLQQADLSDFVRQMGAAASQACTRTMGSHRTGYGTSSLNGTDLLYHVSMLDYALSTIYHGKGNKRHPCDRWNQDVEVVVHRRRGRQRDDAGCFGSILVWWCKSAMSHSHCRCRSEGTGIRKLCSMCKCQKSGSSTVQVRSGTGDEIVRDKGEPVQTARLMRGDVTPHQGQEDWPPFPRSSRLSFPVTKSKYHMILILRWDKVVSRRCVAIVQSPRVVALCVS